MDYERRPGGGEPDDESLENVRDILEQHEQDLAHSLGDISGSPDQMLFASEAEMDNTFEGYVKSLQEALSNVGLYNADDITPDKLKQSDPEILKQLTPHVAESLYFYTYRRMIRWLGNEPLRPFRLIDQAKHLQANGLTLENMQLLQRMKDLEYLGELGFDQSQLIHLLTGSEGRKQNINRLAFLLSLKPVVEPRLKDFINNLKKNAETDGPWSIEATVIEAQEILSRILGDIQERSAPDIRRSWDTISNDLYNRTTHRIGSSIQIGHVILRDMRESTTIPPDNDR